MPPIVVASNRGPVAFVERDGSVEQVRGVGGLVTAVGGAVRSRETVWIAAAITDGDRAVARERAGFAADLGTGAVRVRLADIPPEEYDRYYNEFSNRILWFLHHALWQEAPVLDDEAAASFAAYRRVNETFAGLLAAESPSAARTLPQDYHLSLVPGLLRARRPDVSIGFFWHIPFCTPGQLTTLPEEWARLLLEGMLGADVVGFQAERWARNFAACCEAVLGARTSDRAVWVGGREVHVGVYPIGVDVDALTNDAADPRVNAAGEAIDATVAGRRLMLRVDRTELSKNILRGFLAYERLLEDRADLHERVVHLALLTPSRRTVPEYQRYIAECMQRAERINERFGRDGWTPLVLQIADDFQRTLAAYRRYDVLIVNPVFDGMNLIAREGPILNQRDGALVLSRNAGAAAELAPAALLIDPFDVEETARAMATALDLSPDERRARANALRPLAEGTPPGRWLDLQLADVEHHSPRP